MPLIKLEDFAKANDVTDEELSSLRKFAQEQKEIPIRTNARGEIQVESIYGDNLIKRWREHAQMEGSVVTTSMWEDYLSANDLSLEHIVPCNYVQGIETIDAYVNITGFKIPVLLSIDESKNLLEMQTVEFALENIDYPIEASFSLDRIVWAAVMPITSQVRIRV